MLHISLLRWACFSPHVLNFVEYELNLIVIVFSYTYLDRISSYNLN